MRPPAAQPMTVWSGRRHMITSACDTGGTATRLHVNIAAIYIVTCKLSNFPLYMEPAVRHNVWTETLGYVRHV